MNRIYQPPFGKRSMCAALGHVPTRNFPNGREIPYEVTLCKRCGEKLQKTKEAR